MDAATLYLLASLTGANAPPAVQTDPSGYNTGNVTSATAITKAWSIAPGTPVAGAVYRLEVEFTGTWGANAMAVNVQVGGTWTQFAPSVGAPSWTSGTTIAGSLKMTARVLSSTTARIAVAGSIGETGSSYTPGTGSIALALLSQTLTIAAGDTLALGILFGASTAGQGIASYGSDFTTIGA